MAKFQQGNLLGRNIGSRSGPFFGAIGRQDSPFRELLINARSTALDDSSGTITLSANNRLTRPPQQAAQFLLKWVPGLTTTQVQVGNPGFGGSRLADQEMGRWASAIKAGGAWDNQWQVLDRETVRDHLNRHVNVMPLMITEDMDGTIRFIPYTKGRITSVNQYFITSDHQYHPNYTGDTDHGKPYAIWDMEVGLTPISEVYNRFRIRYWQFREGSPLVYEQIVTEVEADSNVYNTTTRLNDGAPAGLAAGLGYNLSSLCANSQAFYNVQRELVVEMPNVCEHHVASAQLAYLAARYTNQRIVVQGRTGQESVDLKPGHYVTFDNAVNRMHPFLDYQGEPAKGTGWGQSNVNNGYSVQEVTLFPEATGVEVEFKAEQLMWFVSSAWVPDQQLEFQMDMNASNLALNDGDNVELWGNDGIIPIDATNTIPAEQPSFVESALNGLAGVLFSLGGNSLDLTGMTHPAGPYTFVAIYDAQDTTFNGHLFDSQTGRLSFIHSDGGVILNIFQHKDSGGTRNYGVSAINFLMAFWVCDDVAGTAELFVNGTSKGTATYTATAIGGNVRIGSDYNNNALTRLYDATIFRMSLIDRVLTTDERQKWEGYEAHKYNQASVLPGGHPYKTAPPL